MNEKDFYHKFYSKTISRYFIYLYLIDYRKAKEIHDLEKCLKCGHKYYWNNYMRKPRGLPDSWLIKRNMTYLCVRFGLCCSNCNKRYTPQSVRFLGRKIFVFTTILILCCELEKNKCITISKKFVTLIPQLMPQSKKTIKRWLDWWNNIFKKSEFWKAQKGTILNLFSHESLPQTIVEYFMQTVTFTKKAFLKILIFLSPITYPPKYPMRP